ncbi:pyrimidine dimer DNA glycosylase/endonuclease V [Staphylococcus carnosus]|uniref:pyrimidine dimer DNA glycosylase/endonuclease V n=1 Tax=Staphylococcus carnosus TaxID=1281 RepID=UPI00081A373A|nr:pyrimidine dimer DNA glycosylase/endonuclease V [Staphylococcus carnosus]ANZ33939.1 hypothetical protein BEK99_09125 [Staphylococcus carnosus]UTB86120.1 hypothetical protein A2I66_10725 [Staphylococcus carnosus]
MQIFRVSPDPKVSAEFLDNHRLSKQVLELYQIIRVCLGELDVIKTGPGYRHHPVVEAVYNNGKPYLWGAWILLAAMNEEHMRRGGKRSEVFKKELEGLYDVVKKTDQTLSLSHEDLPPFYIEGEKRIYGGEAYQMYVKLLFDKWQHDKIPPRCHINLNNKA